MSDKPLLRAYRGEALPTPPLWLMRQAGRYLPEYRTLRTESGGFLDMVYNPRHASEITLQPIRRYRMDGAILFSDILVIPHAMGQSLDFIEARGPVLSPVRSLQALDELDASRFNSILQPIGETIRLTRNALGTEGFDATTLIGFSGSPWTMACYMVEGGASKEFAHIKSLAYTDPDFFAALLDRLTEAAISYLSMQVDAGVEALQLFESWAGIADADLFQRAIIQPNRKIVQALKKAYPHIPIVGFPRAAGPLVMEYAAKVGVDVLGLDPQWSPEKMRNDFAAIPCLQGNLDPALLLAGGASMARGVTALKAAMAGRAYAFNLGHGVIKETDPEHVAALVNLVRQEQ